MSWHARALKASDEGQGAIPTPVCTCSSAWPRRRHSSSRSSRSGFRARGAAPRANSTARLTALEVQDSGYRRWEAELAARRDAQHVSNPYKPLTPAERAEMEELRRRVGTRRADRP